MALAPSRSRVRSAPPTTALSSLAHHEARLAVSALWPLFCLLQPGTATLTLTSLLQTSYRPVLLLLPRRL
eukprot:4967072-Pleurochrysis_carterae.AAC.1